MNILKPGLRTSLLVLGVCGLVNVARADLFNVQGSTSGAFFNTPQNSHLTFTGTSFGPTTGDQLTLGSFTLGNGTLTYTGTFDLTVTFTLPPGVTGNPIAGDLTGSVQGNSGSVTVDFDGPVHFTFSGGSFDLTANDVTVDTSGRVALTGQLSNEINKGTDAPVPEPFSLVLLATCVGLLAFTRRGRLTGRC